MNTHFGPVESLPFDLRAKRVTTYSSPPDADSRAIERARLRRALTTALVETLALEVPVGQPNEEPVDIEVVRKQIVKALSQSPENLVAALEATLAPLDRFGSIQPSEHASLLNGIVAPNLKSERIPDKYLLALCDKSIAVHPTSSGHINRAFVTGKLALPYESIASYMTAISLGYSNPSLCYLNAGNRYRDMNDHAIALSFYDKAVGLNPLQAEAWWAAAHLSLTENESVRAQQYFSGFLRWFDGLSTEHRTPALAQRAEVARAAIAPAALTTTASSATNV